MKIMKNSGYFNSCEEFIDDLKSTINDSKCDIYVFGFNFDVGYDYCLINNEKSNSYDYYVNSNIDLCKLQDDLFFEYMVVNDNPNMNIVLDNVIDFDEEGVPCIYKRLFIFRS